MVKFLLILGIAFICVIIYLLRDCDKRIPFEGLMKPKSDEETI